MEDTGERELMSCQRIVIVGLLLLISVCASLGYAGSTVNIVCVCRDVVRPYILLFDCGCAAS